MKLSELEAQFSEIEKLMTALLEQEQKLEEANIIFLQSESPKIDYYRFRDKMMFLYQLEKHILQRQTTLVTNMKNYSN